MLYDGRQRGATVMDSFRVSRPVADHIRHFERIVTEEIVDLPLSNCAKLMRGDRESATRYKLGGES